MRTFEPLLAERAYATIAAITSVIERFGGVVGEAAADRVDEVDAAAKAFDDRALPACATAEIESLVVASKAGAAGSAAAAVEAALGVFARLVAAVDLVESVGPVVPGLGLPAACFDGVERPVFPTLGPVLLWLEDEESPPEESAWATPVAAASEAQTPTVKAPVPSHNETLLCGCCARWRAAVRRSLDGSR
ncbi:hypothetical protein MHEL_06710 [Mycolicibacterium helvum]|uniref:Uncharacterized protein n=1 Tax=Mycolicibacterium helvum TaxID=1534349 RepID=A0A7I7T053_9MYCO|nr:hypothetical protein MHEL_06710 [Mycolicibacterium helvum]